MPHRRTSTGSTNASESAPNASKNVALPTMMRARTCHRENGSASSRAMRSAFAEASADKSAGRKDATQLRSDAVREFDGRQVARAREDRERGLWNRFVQLRRHGDRCGVVLLANDDGDRHCEGAERGARVGGAEQFA